MKCGRSNQGHRFQASACREVSELLSGTAMLEDGKIVWGSCPGSNMFTVYAEQFHTRLQKLSRRQTK